MQNLFMPYGNTKDADQSAHPCSLISVFVIHSLDSTIPVDVVLKVSRLRLASAAEQTSLSLMWLHTSEDYVAHIRCGWATSQENLSLGFVTR